MIAISPLLIVILLWLSVAVVAFLLGRFAPRRAGAAGWLGVLAGAATLWLALAAPDAVLTVNWVPGLELRFELGWDAFGAVFVAVVGGIGMAVFAYSAVYFTGKPGGGRFVGVLAVFAVAMLGLVISQDVFTLFVFWEATTFSSYLLIGHHRETASARSAARQAALVTGAGGLVLLAGLIVLSAEAGTTAISALVQARPTSSVGWVLVLVGAMTKSAQFPFHTWLPAAMAAPTPASAFLHSATMVKAGILLLGRLGPGTTEVAWWTPAIVSIGLVTMLVGSVGALRRHDLKLLLAYGTISQLGLMFATVGSGMSELMTAGLVVLVAHALYKSTLFLVVGVVDSTEHTRDIRRLGGLWLKAPALTTVAAISAASMAGVILTLGFVAKEALLESSLGFSNGLALVIAALSALSAAYSTRFVLGGFGGQRASRTRLPEPWKLLIGPAGLTVGAVALAFLPNQLATAAADAVQAVTGSPAVPPKVVVWPGLVPAFGLSLAGLIVGAVLGWLSLSIPDRRPSVGRAHGFDRGVDVVQRLAERLTGVIQNGSLPAYLGQILLVAVIAPLPALVRAGAVPVPPVGTTTEWIVAGVVIVSSIALLRIQRRMVAVLLLGAVGYGMAALFALRGAPDVALTQILVETLVVTLFVLALRVLPLRFGASSPVSGWKVAVALTAGVVMASVALLVGSVDQGEPVSSEHIARSVPEANGANVVNVTLVDFRAMDTLGEITVLGVAALGVLALIRPFGDRFASRRYQVQPSVVLSRGAIVAGPLLIVFAIYLLLAGHNQSGGGFAAGLVASGWIILRWLDRGRLSSAFKPSLLIGAGLALALLVALGGYWWADAFGASAAWTVQLPVFGEVKAVSSLALDLGVATLVIGAVAGAVKGLEAS